MKTSCSHFFSASISVAVLILVAAEMLLVPGYADPLIAGKPQQLNSPDQVPEGLAKSDWASIRTAYEAGRHAFQPVDGGWQARNPGQQWTTKFDGRGFLAQPQGKDWQWGLELRIYGFSGSERRTRGAPAVQADGTRVTYRWETTVQEWFVNDVRGLEHGFTVRERPMAGTDAAGSLQFHLAVRGSLTPHVGKNGRGGAFQDAAGAVVLYYPELKVWDTDGQVFAAMDTSTPGALRLLVYERGTRYPITVHPIAQHCYLKASNNGNADAGEFSFSDAGSAGTVGIGAPFEASGHLCLGFCSSWINVQHRAPECLWRQAL